MAYLTFMIDNYERIPAAGVVMVHGTRFAWHNDWPNYDNQALLGALNVSAALSPSGYHNLKCDWSASTCPPDSGPPQGSIGEYKNCETDEVAGLCVRWSRYSFHAALTISHPCCSSSNTASSPA